MRTAWSGADAHILGMRAACGKTVPLIMAAFADICGCATCGAVKLRGSRGVDDEEDTTLLMDGRFGGVEYTRWLMYGTLSQILRV